MPVIGNPYVIDFGSLPVGSSDQRTSQLYNYSYGNVQVTDITVLGGIFSYVGPATPFNIPPYSAVEITVQFDPLAVTPYGDSVNIFTSDGATNIGLLGEGIAAGDRVISANPNPYDFGEVKVGQNSTEKLIVITNVGNGNCEITAFNYTAPFIAGNNTPSLPLTLDKNNNNNVSVGVVFSPANNGYASANNGLIVTSNANNSPLNVELAGTGILITPAYNLTGNASKMVLCFQDANNGAAALREMNVANLNCEESAYVRKQVNLSFYKISSEGLTEEVASGFEKQLMRSYVKYEDKGVGNFTLKATSERGENNSQLVAVGTNNATGNTRTAVVDLTVVDEVLTMNLSRNANSGPLSMTEVLLKFEPKGEIVK